MPTLFVLQFGTYAWPNLAYPHQNRSGIRMVKNVCVPRFAVNAKYVSRVGVRTFSWNQARYGVSKRTMGRIICRGLYRQWGSVLRSIQVEEYDELAAMKAVKIAE